MSTLYWMILVPVCGWHTQHWECLKPAHLRWHFEPGVAGKRNFKMVFTGLEPPDEAYKTWLIVGDNGSPYAIVKQLLTIHSTQGGRLEFIQNSTSK